MRINYSSRPYLSHQYRNSTPDWPSAPAGWGGSLDFRASQSPDGVSDRDRKPDGGAYLYYTCLSAIKDHPHRKCTVRSLPARAFEEAFIEKIEELAADSTLVQRSLMEGTAADRNDVARLQKTLGKLHAELADADERMGRLLGIFEEAETIPEGLKTRCCELDEQRAGLRLEIAPPLIIRF